MPNGRPADGAGCLLAVLAGFGFTAWVLGSLAWQGLRALFHL